jgi:DNA-binding NtrC family response regulator
MQFDNKSTNQVMVQIVDDEFDIVNVLKLYLQQVGLKVFGFTDPYLALEHFRINCKDYILVVSDIRMPGMNGFEFVRNIREIKPEVKVLLMTAFDINTNIVSEELLSTKVNGFIQKPVSSKELNNIILKHIPTCSIKKNKDEVYFNLIFKNHI